MKVLIQANSGLLSDIMALALEGVLGGECTQVDDKDQALKAAKSESFDLLIVESDESDDQLVSMARTKRIPLIRLSSSGGELKPGGWEKEFVLTHPLDVKDLLDLVRYALKGNVDKDRDDEFCQVRIDTLLMVGNQFDFDIFVRLSSSKFVKVVKKGDPFDGEKYARFLQKGIRYLHVPKEDFIQYLSAMATLLNKMISTENVALDDAAQAGIRVYESFRDGIRSLGITPETQRVMKLTVNLAIRSIEKDPKLKDLFSAFSKNQESFQAWHSVALSFIACKLCSLMTWNSQNTHFKLALASILHDIALKKPEWAEFEREADAEKAGLSGEDLESYRNHPLEAGELVKRLDDFPGDVDYIISQHHELPDGSGYPTGQNHTKISPLSSLFIVAHDLCHRLYLEGENFDFLRFLQDFDERYPLGYFRKIRVALEKLPHSELR